MRRRRCIWLWNLLARWASALGYLADEAEHYLSTCRGCRRSAYYSAPCEGICEREESK